jgi:hypothetical protein
MLVVGVSHGGDIAPNVPALVTLWSLTAVPATVLLGSLAFGLGTLYPRRSNPVKVLVIIMWIASINVIAAVDAFPIKSLEPSGMGFTGLIRAEYSLTFMSRTPDITPRTFARSAADLDPFPVPAETSDQRDREIWQNIIRVAQERPHLAQFVPYRVALALIGLAIVAVVARRFDRFSSDL